LLAVAIDSFIYFGGVNVFELPYFAGEPETLLGDKEPDMPSVWEEVKVTGEELEDTGEEVEGTDITTAQLEKYDEYLSTCYAYNTLDNEMKNLYIEVYSTMSKFEDKAELSVLDIDKLNLAYQCVMIDHPEIFYSDGYAYSQYTKGDVATRLTFEPNYICSKEEADMLNDEMYKVIPYIVHGISPDADDYDKVKYVYDYLVHNTEYDANAPDNQNICSVFLNHKSVCQGYAKATQLLLNAMMVDCTLVTGVVNGDEGHSWNMVKMNGDYYYVDTTWGDASYQSVEGQDVDWLNNLDIVNYDYLGVTTDEIQKTHIIDNPVPLPICTSKNCNYYVKEGNLLESTDKEELARIFLRHPLTSQNNTTIKCSSREVYNWLLDTLITESKIFDYVDDTAGTVGYAQNEDALSLTLWLDD